MSKSTLNTRQQILSTALTAFNKHGIEAVGVRDIAALLELSAGNITYYFPTKDEMIKELVAMLESDIRVLTDKVKIESIGDFFAQQKQVMEVQFNYRSVFLSYGSLMVYNKKVAGGLKKFEKKRAAHLKSILQSLSKNSFLEKLSPSDQDALLSQILSLSNSWISSALADNPGAKKEASTKEGAKSLAFLIQPFLSKKGKADLIKALKAK